MQNLKTIWLLMLSIVIVALLMIFATKVRADTPMCNEIVQDPTIATCTCICEASSQFSGCEGLAAGTAAATPNQCPDMLQGRRVLLRGDALAVADPNGSGSADTRILIYKTENDSNNPGLGVVVTVPDSTTDVTVPCDGSVNFPLTQQTRFARLFDLPYDMVVTLRPTTNANDLNADCTPASGTDANLGLDVTSPNSGAPQVPELVFGEDPQ